MGKKGACVSIVGEHCVTSQTHGIMQAIHEIIKEVTIVF